MNCTTIFSQLFCVSAIRKSPSSFAFLLFRNAFVRNLSQGGGGGKGGCLHNLLRLFTFFRILQSQATYLSCSNFSSLRLFSISSRMLCYLTSSSHTRSGNRDKFLCL